MWRKIVAVLSFVPDRTAGSAVSSISCNELTVCAICTSQQSSVVRSNCLWCEGEQKCKARCLVSSNEGCSAEASCPARPSPKVLDLDHTKWFLTSQELKDSMGGFDRANPPEGVLPLQVFTIGNDVRNLQTGKDVFKAWSESLNGLQDGDWFKHTGWMFGPGSVPLEPGSNDTIASTIRTAIQRGVNARFLVFRNLGEIKGVNADAGFHELRLMVNETATNTSFRNGKRSSLVIDGRAPPIGSIHQKHWTAYHAGSDTMESCLGGVDITWKRWDTKYHNDPPECKSFLYGEQKCGWVDRHMCVKGPGAADIGNSFGQRWNSRVKMDAKGIPLSLITFAAGNEVTWVEENPVADEIALTAKANVGGAAVQILRTYPCGYSMLDGSSQIETYAPKGEQSYLQGVLKAVSLAQYFIYIEDQFAFWQPHIFDALSKALERGVQVTILYARKSSAHAHGCKDSQHNMLQPMLDGFPDLMKVFWMKNVDTFVHSKLFVVDDVWASIGSANIGRRSFTYDPEIGAAVVDSVTVQSADGRTVAKFAHDVRIQAMAEIGNFSESMIRNSTYGEALAKLSSAESICENVTELPSTMGGAAAKELCDATDPDGSCDDPAEVKGTKAIDNCSIGTASDSLGHFWSLLSAFLVSSLQLFLHHDV